MSIKQVLSIAILLLVVGTSTAINAAFTAFESGPVRPLAMSPDGQRLYVTNTPDNRVEVFRITPSGLAHLTSIPVGMEPVALAVRSANEIWVVNHLSDSVSIVKSDAEEFRVVRTLQVGDEPRDIVFAGPGGNRAFITAANRDLNRPVGSKMGNADVWVFDADNLGGSVEGDPLTVINLFTDVPRGLAVSNDGNRVYAAAFHSGSRTTVVSPKDLDGDLPPPDDNVDGVKAPPVGLIVKWYGAAWRDATGRDLSHLVDITLPDKDLFVIDAAADVPVENASVSGIGTTLFNLAVNPVSGEIYVSNLEAQNHVRFEGPGVHGGSSLRGHISENSISIVDGSTVSRRHLNKHIDFDRFPGTARENARSLAFPLQMVVSSDGNLLYVAAFG